MVFYLKQSTASQSRLIGPFVDDTDFKTLETGLTIANTDVKISKNGGTGANKNSGGGTHRNNGMYSFTFDATDTDTVGELAGSISVSGALVVTFKAVVLEEAIYDALFAASANAFTGAAGSTDFNATQKASINTEADTALTDYDPPTRAELTTDTNSILTRLGTPAGVSVSADIATVDSNVDAILVDTNSLNDTKIPDTISLANINAQVDTALTDIGLDHLFSAAVIGTDVADNSFAARITSKSATADFDDFVNTTDSLQALRDQGDSAWITATGFSTHTAANVRTEMDSNSTQLAAIVADTNELQTDDVPGLIAALNDLSAAQVNAQVDTALADIHLDHLLAVTYDPATKPGVSDALLNELIESDAGVSRFTANSLEQGPVATGFSTHSAADVWSAVTRTLTAGTNLNDISAADVNAQVVDVLRTDTVSELSAIPAASPNLHAMVQLLYMALRNKLDVTASAKEVHNVAGTVLGTKTLSDDGTTYSETKMA